LPEFNPYAGPTGGIDKMPDGTHGSAHPLSASPVTSGLREDECTSPCPGLCLGWYHTGRQPGEALQNTVK
jgi:hypothetical protein